MCGSSEQNKYKQKQKTRLWERRLSSVAPGPGGVELALLVKVEGDARVGDAEVVNHIHVPHLVRKGHHQVPRQAADVVQVRRGDLGAVAVRHVGPQAALANEGLHRPVEGEHRHPPGEEAPRGPALARPLVVHRGVAEAVGHGVLVENWKHNKSKEGSVSRKHLPYLDTKENQATPPKLQDSEEKCFVRLIIS